VRLISLGITILPSSSIRLTMPVAFICCPPFSCDCFCCYCLLEWSKYAGAMQKWLTGLREFSALLLKLPA